MSARRQARAAAAAPAPVSSRRDRDPRQVYRERHEDKELGEVLITFHGAEPYRAKWSGTPEHPGGFLSWHHDPETAQRLFGHLV